MIGVAFALRETFGISNGIEGAAFTRVLREFAELRGLDVDAVRSKGNAAGKAVEIASSAGLRNAFSSALLPYLLHEAEDVNLEAMFCMQAARMVNDRFVAFDDVAPTLRELSTLNVPSVALSGGWPSVDARKAQIVGFASPVIFAEEFNVEVSAPTAFARVAEALRLPAESIWFVGTDAHAEIMPASATGMHTIWINRYEETFPSHRTAPDATVESFEHLLDVLSEPYTRGLLALRQLLTTALDWRPGHFIAADDPIVLADRTHGDDV